MSLATDYLASPSGSLDPLYEDVRTVARSSNSAAVRFVGFPDGSQLAIEASVEGATRLYVPEAAAPEPFVPHVAETLPATKRRWYHRHKG